MTGIPANKTAEKATLKKEKNARNALKEHKYEEIKMQLRLLVRMASKNEDDEIASLAFSVLNAEKEYLVALANFDKILSSGKQTALNSNKLKEAQDNMRTAYRIFMSLLDALESYGHGEFKHISDTLRERYPFGYSFALPIGNYLLSRNTVLSTRVPKSALLPTINEGVPLNEYKSFLSPSLSGAPQLAPSSSGISTLSELGPSVSGNGIGHINLNMDALAVPSMEPGTNASSTAAGIRALERQPSRSSNTDSNVASVSTEAALRIHQMLQAVLSKSGAGSTYGGRRKTRNKRRSKSRHRSR